MLKKLLKKTDPAALSALTTASLLGLHLVSGIIAGGLIGYGIDAWFDTKPKGLMIGILVGIIAGFKNLYVDAKRLISAQKDKSEKK